MKTMIGWFLAVLLISLCRADTNDCECVPYYLCVPDDTFLHSAARADTVKCEHYLEMCCPPAYIKKYEEVIPNYQPPVNHEGVGSPTPDDAKDNDK